MEDPKPALGALAMAAAAVRSESVTLIPFSIDIVFDRLKLRSSASLGMAHTKLQRATSTRLAAAV